MRTLWNIVAFLSVVNLLSLAIGGGWLWWSGRVDHSRFEEAKAIFFEPIAVVEATRVETVAREAKLEAVALEERRWGQLPVSSVRAIDESERWSDLGASMQASLEAQAEAFLLAINTRYEVLSAAHKVREAALRKAEEVLEARLARQDDEDFRAMAATVAALRDRDAMAILMSYINSGDEMIVVSVLAVLDEDRRTKLIAEFVKEGQEALASRLLIELRDQGKTASVETENFIAASRSDANPVNAAGPSRRISGS